MTLKRATKSSAKGTMFLESPRPPETALKRPKEAPKGLQESFKKREKGFQKRILMLTFVFHNFGVSFKPFLVPNTGLTRAQNLDHNRIPETTKLPFAQAGSPKGEWFIMHTGEESSYPAQARMYFGNNSCYLAHFVPYYLE